MRWIDKPRKKTRREIVLEYIKFLKIMGYYSELVAYMYSLARDKGTYVHFYSKDKKVNTYMKSDITSHNQVMIGFFEYQLESCGTHLREWVVRERLIQWPLKMYDYNKSWDLTELLWSYFKEKHIDNCIIID